jgi:hypothetical protein
VVTSSKLTLGGEQERPPERPPLADPPTPSVSKRRWLSLSRPSGHRAERSGSGVELGASVAHLGTLLHL